MSGRGGASSARVAAAPAPVLAHKVRIIGGRWKRTSLPVPDVDGLRPSADRVRDALFDVLAEGVLFLPIGECDNHDPKKGCQGHPIPDETSEAKPFPIRSSAPETPTAPVEAGAVNYNPDNDL